ncbi:DUF1634 domain-containing protein [Pedobacter psychroterrae]|uniref:DUF1634 domain-containing protein n=2 Tax=Pedobacter psychroterrae TaxID=2530453 RepID=A0A4R0NS79_9SPHI|nr:DUF1634 domain-containing protein [Pedobacter psychroterrae]
MKRVTKHFFADKDIQVILGTLLRVGVIVSMTVIFVGGLLYLLHHEEQLVDYHVFNSLQQEYSSISSILLGLSRFNAKAIIQFGILLLIFTPVARVVFSVFSFIIERDYLYVIIGLLVFGIILFSLSNRLVH